MDQHTDGDFSRFVEARWPGLVRTAYLVCGDRERAVRTTAEVLAGVGARWRQVADEGAPTAEARAALLRRLVHDDRPAAGDAAEPQDPPAVDAALVRAYAGLPVLARVALALERGEGLSVEESALALQRPAAEVLEAAAAARGLLADVHAAARSRLGLPPAEYAVEGEVDGALRTRAAEVDAVGDPVRLVGSVRASRRRRTGLATVGLGAVVALAAVGIGARTGAGGGPTAGPSPTTISASDPRWADASTWPPRGELANDPAIRQLISDDWGARAQLVYAGDVGGTRMVIGWDAGRGGYAPQVEVIAGPADRPLTDVPSAAYPAGTSRNAIVVLGVPSATSVPLLVLAPPSTTEVRTSTTVSYDQRRGRVNRSWSAATLTDGVAKLALPALQSRGEAGYGWVDVPALRVLLDGFDGPPANQTLPRQVMTPPECPACSVEEWAARTIQMTLSRISAATGLPEDQIDARVLAAGTIRTDAADDAVVRLVGTRADISCIRYRLPGGATLASTVMRGLSGSIPSFSVGRLDVVPAAVAGLWPCLQLVGHNQGGALLYALAAPGAHAVQVAPDPASAGKAGPVVRTPDGVALLAVDPGPGQLRILDAQGRVAATWGWPGLAQPVDAFDLGPTVYG